MQLSATENTQENHHHQEYTHQHMQQQPTIQTHLEVYASTYENLEKEKLVRLLNYQVEEEEDLTLDPVFLCVDPFLVNPLVYAAGSTEHQNLTTKDTSNSNSPQGRIKLEMEEFGDLSSYVQKRHGSTNSVDELDTPIFDKDAFDFGTNTTNNTTTINATNIFINNIFDDMEKQQIIEQQLVQLRQPEIQQQQQQQKLETSIVKLEKTTSDKFIRDNNLKCEKRDNNILLFSNNNNNISSNSKVSNISDTKTMMTSYFNTTTNHSKGRLSLNLPLQPMGSFDQDLTTPSIIQEVVDLEAAAAVAGFSIFDLVEKEDSHQILDFSTTPTTTFPVLPTVPPKVEPVEVVKIPKKELKIEPKIPKKQRKRRHLSSGDDDSDSDYTPTTKATPTKKSKLRPQITQITKYDSDSSLSSSLDDVTNSSSVTSPSLDDASKYRELRDKNNEASRKSRLKRKLKELELEREAEELRGRNVKLRAKSEELEKLVTNFRENLFKMMMKK